MADPPEIIELVSAITLHVELESEMDLELEIRSEVGELPKEVELTSALVLETV